MRYTTQCIKRNGSECVECFLASSKSMRNLGDWPDWMHEACNRNLDEEGALCNHNGTYWIHQPGLDGKMVKVSGVKYIVYHEEKDYICLWNANDFEEDYQSINSQGGLM